MSSDASNPTPQHLQISGIYPHLAVFSMSGEVGSGALVPWAGRLWWITYPQHDTRGGKDKLYEVDADLNRITRPESVGGTHAARMYHRESNQLIIGPYFIDAERNVRACDLNVLVGRMTAVARHLTDPANKVYYVDMEGAIYEVDVHTLAVTLLFEKPVPGWHAKGGYTGQGHLVISNNGEASVGNKQYRWLADVEERSPEDAGVLAEWDGTNWRVILRRQFCEVTGPGGLWGNPDDKAPIWATGWDKRSILLMLRDGGKWHRFRLPKASHTYDPRHGWYTEWPRIRDVGGGHWLMTMHGMLWSFPPTFSEANTCGLRPISSHLRYIPDFCDWDGRLILGADDTSIMENPMAGQAQSNLWFGTWEELRGFGPRSGWGGPWQGDAIKAGEASDPFLVAGFDRRTLHISHDCAQSVTFLVELGSPEAGWREAQRITVPARGYTWRLLPGDLGADWLRLSADRDCVAHAYLHETSARHEALDRPGLFEGVARADATGSLSCGIIRPGRHNENLQLLATVVDADGRARNAGYREVDADFAFTVPAQDRTQEVLHVASIRPDFVVDAASVVMVRDGLRRRLPKSDPAFDRPFAWGWPRCVRECVSERFLVNAHGIFYELPRDRGLPQIKPVCTHGRQIMDFCTWRGLMVLSGVPADAAPDGHVFRSADGALALWFGHIDDLWQMGKPVGYGGPWKDTPVEAGQPSDPFLMTGFDRKRVEMSHDCPEPVTITLEVDFDHTGWHPYESFRVAPGATVEHAFAEGFSAHWVRAIADRTCRATVMFRYE